MSVDEITKLILVLSVSFAIVGIAFQFMRLIGKLTDSLQDLRKAIQNISKASDMILDDYTEIRVVLHKVLDIANNITSFLGPLKSAASLAKRFAGKRNRAEEGGDGLDE